MNQAQRKFLIDKINSEVDSSAKAMEREIPSAPDARNFILLALMDGSLRMRTSDELLHVLKERVKSGKDAGNFLTGERSSWDSVRTVKFSLDEAFILPTEYSERYSEYIEKKKAIEAAVRLMRENASGLCTRIQLASDKTLDKMIAEVDDMGDISLMDGTLRALTAGTYEGKLLSE